MHNGSDKNGQNDSRHIDNDIDEYELYYGEYAVKEAPDEKNKLPGPLSRRPSFSSAIPSITLSVLFVICTYTLSSISFQDYLWASRETVFTEHEYWRLVTAIFTHSDIVHMLSNIPFFIFFGIMLYEYFGFMIFPVVSLIIGTVTNAFTLCFYHDAVRLVGASGMIYGMVSMWLVLYIYHDTDRTITVRILRATGFTIIVLFPETYNPSTSYLAHAAGFCIGILSALITLPFVKVRGRRSGRS